MRVSELRARALKRIDPAAAVDLPTAELQRQLEQIIHEIANDERYELSAREQSRLAEELANDMTGYGPLEPLLRDATVTDIMVNGPASVYVERGGKLELHRRSGSATPTTSPRSRRRSPRGSAGGSTNRARWWTPGCTTAAG